MLGRLASPPAPPGPFRPRFWRSPLRGPWLTAVFSVVLLVGVSLVAVTGFLSYAAYNPALGGNDLTSGKGLLGFYLFDWPTEPVWLYRVTQGAHVILGLTLVPILLAKLWSVIPKLFDWPPLRSPAHALERASLLLLVGGAVFEFATGIVDIQIFYGIFPFDFYTAHLYGGWVFLAAFLVHVVMKFPTMMQGVRSRSLREELRTGLADTRPEPPDPDGLVAVEPAPPTVSRRGALGFVGAGALTVFALSIGQTIDGPLRRTALLAPHGRDYGSGPNDFQINKTAATVGVDTAQTGPSYRLELVGSGSQQLSRADLEGLQQYTYDLPIACVEGWSTQQTWTGVRLRDLARMAGVDEVGTVFVESLQSGGAFSRTTLSGDQVRDARSLLALSVNGVDLSLDHGYPARVIVPANPGVHNTKWVSRLTFMAPGQ